MMKVNGTALNATTRDDRETKVATWLGTEFEQLAVPFEVTVTVAVFPLEVTAIVAGVTPVGWS